MSAFSSLKNRLMIRHMVIPATANALVRTVVMERIIEANCQVSFSFLSLSLNSGINDAVSAPSPKILLDKLGIVRAVMKADIAPLVPKKRAKRISRARPLNRLAKFPKAVFTAEDD